MNNGIYKGMSWKDYLSIKLPSPSLLKHGLRSMKRLKRAMDYEIPGPSEKVTAVGNAVHCMIAREFNERCAVLPAFENDTENVTATGKQSRTKTTSYYRQSLAAFKADNKYKILLNEVQSNVAAKTWRAIMANEHAKEMIDATDLARTSEVVVVGEIEGVKVKTRMDGLLGSHGWDLKTTNDIEETAFYRRAKGMGYFFQFAMHYLLLQSNGVLLDQYSVIAAETQDDFDVGVLTVPMVLIDVWMERAERVCGQFRTSIETGVWPGIYAEPTPFNVPNWDMATDESIELDWSE